MLWKSCGSLWKSLPLNTLGETAHNMSAKGPRSSSRIALLPTRGQASFRSEGDSGRADPVPVA